MNQDQPRRFLESGLESMGKKIKMASHSPQLEADKGEEEPTISCAEALATAFDEQTSKVIDLHYGFPLAMGWTALSATLHHNKVFIGPGMKKLVEEGMRQIEAYKVLGDSSKPKSDVAPSD